ncbi:hypothetical protein LCGC14_2602920 [marine sediment metagenome]|uniref:Uncharacterized protein n=1 Tax=marine sediment metagenome TaxID=412755 RepID=A0A0F9AVZ0_9ZZZZ
MADRTISAKDQKSLDVWADYLSIKYLFKKGMVTPDQIAEKLDLRTVRGRKMGLPDRAYIVVRIWLSRMPSKVEDAMRQYTFNPDSTAIRWNHVVRLFKVYNAEFPVYPNGDGPLFSAEFAEVFSN